MVAEGNAHPGSEGSTADDAPLLQSAAAAVDHVKAGEKVSYVAPVQSEAAAPEADEMVWHVAPEQQSEVATPIGSLSPIRRQRTGVKPVHDPVGEGDGCDRCFGKGCDEEACCPSFWQDEGVPPVWPFSWIFSRTNPYLNDNHAVFLFGHCGLKAADRERKVLMGTALAFTVVSIILTTFGCLGLSPNLNLERSDAWAVGHLLNRERGEGTVAWVGLSRLLIERCSDVRETDAWGDWQDCEVFPHWWSEVPNKCRAAQATEKVSNSSRLDEEFGYPCDVLLKCAEQATANQFGAFMTCVTLIFALIGCLTRIRKRADTNFQKILGTLPDMLGIFTLGGALVSFSARCTSAMVDDGHGHGTGYAPGPGFIAYCCCWVAAVVRCSMHAIMPVPGAGVSCARALEWSSSGEALVMQ
ncbi:hypothetical protein T492DRAFT_1024685 [Pavlovales sp. CCMP2436]|nr:hypothetical protein T492DRAFT_1024685 [Pavlovales sp. CCMP2436]